MDDLIKKKCVPCEKKGVRPMDKEEAIKYLAQIPGWDLDDVTKKISREFLFRDFIKSIDFVSGPVADISEEEGHHPDIYIFYNKVRLEISTHAIEGLSVNDFILAAKINRALESYKKFGA